jgi:hypothetical protein
LSVPPPAFHSKVDEAEWGNESQERDRILMVTRSTRVLPIIVYGGLRRLELSDDGCGYHSSTQKESDDGLVGPLPDKEGNMPEVAETGFPARPHTRRNLQQRSNGEKEEQDSKFLLFLLTGLANDGLQAVRPWCWYCEREFEDEKGTPYSYSSGPFCGRTDRFPGFFSVDAAPKG